MPELTYVFVVRHPQQWASFTLIPRPALDEYYQFYNVGNVAKKALVLTFHYKQASLTCSGQDLSAPLNDWSHFLVIEH